MIVTLSKSFSTGMPPSDHVRACAAMFGIGLDDGVRISLYENVKLDIKRGTIVYLTGESGAGKSCMLRDIHASLRDSELVKTIDVAGEVSGGSRNPEGSLLDQFGDEGLPTILELLNSVGISEPFVYLRRFRELSDGQRYRFMLAQMIYEGLAFMKAASPDAIAIVYFDEFLAFLDRETARNVAYQVRRAATRRGLSFVVATTHQDIANDLQADITVRMKLNRPPELVARKSRGDT